MWLELLTCPSCAPAADCGAGTARAALSRTRGSGRTTTHGPVPIPAPDTPVPGNAERGLKAPGRARQSSAVMTPGVRTSKLISVTLGTSLQECRQLAHGHVGSLRNGPFRGQHFFNLRFSTRDGSYGGRLVGPGGSGGCPPG